MRQFVSAIAKNHRLTERAATMLVLSVASIATSRKTSVTNRHNQAISTGLYSLVECPPETNAPAVLKDLVTPIMQLAHPAPPADLDAPGNYSQVSMHYGDVMQFVIGHKQLAAVGYGGGNLRQDGRQFVTMLGFCQDVKRIYAEPFLSDGMKANFLFCEDAATPPANLFDNSIPDELAGWWKSALSAKLEGTYTVPADTWDLLADHHRKGTAALHGQIGGSLSLKQTLLNATGDKALKVAANMAFLAGIQPGAEIPSSIVADALELVA